MRLLRENTKKRISFYSEDVKKKKKSVYGAYVYTSGSEREKKDEIEIINEVKAPNVRTRKWSSSFGFYFDSNM